MLAFISGKHVTSHSDHATLMFIDVIVYIVFLSLCLVAGERMNLPW